MIRFILLDKVPKGDDLVHVVDSQDVAALHEHIPALADEDFNSYLVRIDEGEYVEVYACTRKFDLLNAYIYKVIL